MALAPLLAELFDDEGLRQLVTAVDPAAMSELPGTGASPGHVARHTVFLFRARGQVDQLVNEAVVRRPVRAGELAEALTHELTRPPLPPAPATHLPSLRSSALPPRPYFTGREAELEQLRDWIKSPGQATLRAM